MKLLDSDILGILLALATFVVPAITGILEKKRKENKRREAELLGRELPEESPNVEGEPLNEEMEELFNVLLGKQEDEQELEPQAEPQQQPQVETAMQPEPVVIEENVVLQTQRIAPPMEIELPDEIMKVEEASGEKMGEESIKERLKRNPKEAVILSEILTPKFKQYN